MRVAKVEEVNSEQDPQTLSKQHFEQQADNQIVNVFSQQGSTVLYAFLIEKWNFSRLQSSQSLIIVIKRK